MIHVVDSHAIIWFLQGSRLGARARAILRRQSAELVIPTIVLAEIRYLKARGRIGPSLSEVLDVIERDDRFTVYPFDENVLSVMPLELDIHDAIIVGTALVYRDVLGADVRVITRDPRIQTSGIIETVW